MIPCSEFSRSDDSWILVSTFSFRWVLLLMTTSSFKWFWMPPFPFLHPPSAKLKILDVTLCSIALGLILSIFTIHSTESPSMLQVELIARGEELVNNQWDYIKIKRVFRSESRLRDGWLLITVESRRKLMSGEWCNLYSIKTSPEASG